MSSDLASLSETLALTVQSAGSSVVQVNGRRRLPASGIIWSAEGSIVTASHVVKRDDNIAVTLPDGETVKASLTGRDATTDLAVLRVEDSGLSPAVRITGDFAVGHLVLALGRPGRTVQATLGIISALGSGWRTGLGGQIDHYLQTDVLMYPGFSGGPLVNAQGQIIGLNTSALMRGVSLTVPVSTVERVVETLQTYGRMRKGYLGVSTQPVRLPEAVKQVLKQETGLLVVSVEEDSPADKGGLVMGDAIVGLNDDVIGHHDHLLNLLAGDRINQEIAIKIVRGGKVQSISVTIGERS